MKRRTFIVLASFFGGGGLFLLALQHHSADAQTVISLTDCDTITSSGSYRLANNVSGGAWCFSIRASNVTFDGNGKTITSSTGEALEVAHYSGTAPTNVTVSNFTSSGGVRVYGDDVDTVTIENLHVSGITNYAGDHVTIRNNVVGAGGISDNNADQVGWAPIGNTITGNTVTGGSTDVKILVEVVGGRDHPCPRTNTVLSNNTITDTRNDPPPEATATVRVRCATHVMFSNNTVRSTGTTIGLYMRDEADDGVYENNSFWVNSQEAIRIASGNVDKTLPARNVFRNNLFRSDAGASTFFQGIGNSNTFTYNVFWSQLHGFWNMNDNNTFDHNTFYVKGTNESIGSLAYSEALPDTWTNNIFSVANGTILDYDAPWSFAKYVGDYNLFQNRSGSVSFGSPAGSLSAWRTASGNTDDMHSLEANPDFSNAASGDFTLQVGSPALNAASDGSDIGAKHNTAPPPTCTENWSCGSWGTCSNGQQTRTCTDANDCGTTTSRPALSQSCSCTENWTCGAWTACANSEQTRTCTDQNNCGTTVNKPSLIQACAGTDTLDVTPPAPVHDLRGA